MDKRARVEEFCAGVRASVKDAVARYCNGDSWQFHQMLLAQFPEAKPWVDVTTNQVLTELYGKLWDITGWVWTVRREPPFILPWDDVSDETKSYVQHRQFHSVRGEVMG